MNDANEIAKIIKNEVNNAVKELSQKTFYRGVVDAVVDNIADIFIEGSADATPSITCIGSYNPIVGDVVMVVSIGTTGANFLCLGKIDGYSASNVIHGTSATPPTASTTPEGTVYVQYTA